MSQALHRGCAERLLFLYIQGIRLKAALLSGLSQTDRIENAGRHAVAIGGVQDLRLAGIGGGVGRAGSETR